jgi:hypothetical protein
MRDSYTSHEAGREHGMAAVHRYWFGVPVETTTPDLPAQISTGFLVASAEDMARYLLMYLDDGAYDGQTILSPAGIATLREPATNEFTRTLLGSDFTARYGMGWFAGRFGAEPALWHLGELPSFNAWMVMLPERDLGVVVLINAGSQMDIAGANEVFSRIPIGVTNLLTGHEPPTGLSLSRFYVVFDLIVLTIIALQVWRLIVIARRAETPHRGWRLTGYIAPFVWEFGLSLLLLIGYPATTGVGWSANLNAVPDLTLVALAVATLWILTGATRAVTLVRPHARQRATRAPRQDVREVTA